MIQERFPKSLVDDMFDGNARFGHILHLPTLILSEGRDQEFMDLVDDIACHAAEMVAKGYAGHNLDGLGVLDGYNVTYPQVPDTKFTEINFYIDSGVIGGEADKS